MKRLTVFLLLLTLLFVSCTQTTPTTPTTTAGNPTAAQQKSATQEEAATVRPLPEELEVAYCGEPTPGSCIVPVESFIVRDPAVIRKLMDFRAGSFQESVNSPQGSCDHWVVYGESDVVGLYRDADYGDMGESFTAATGDRKKLPKGMAAYVTAVVEEHRRENPVTTAEQVGVTSEVLLDKPVIYLYPAQTTDIQVKLDIYGELKVCYPAYNNGWSVAAQPDGTLTNHADGKEYSYLFWEGTSRTEYDFSRGFVVKGSDTAAFLQEKLACMGLTPREYNEFIVYWLPQMQNNLYNLIAFQGEAYTESAKLDITPAPDSLLRVFMAFHPLEKPISVEEQVLEPFVRQGFAVVEWGGAVVR